MKKMRKKKTCNNRHFNIKLTPKLLDDIHIICITLPDNPGEASEQMIGFKICPFIGNLRFSLH
jgi:hypothetical protein